MYESHFGLSGPPFQLNPDPSFYFDSRGHSHALSYLRYGVYQGEGFIVVTGDIGAGKTTLVRTLLGGLDPRKVVAAQVVSTQLNSGDLLQAIIAAFGIKPLGPTKAQALTTLEAFLTALVTKQRRALLVVDEAQNLNREAVEELRMLSNFQIGHHALLQSFLIGQPELRRMLESKNMEQFRQRVIASCHLGPLDAIETRAYVEHRLHRVGWKNSPAFSDSAFEAIYAHAAGIPRRINLLCNRLLLGAFLAGSDQIDADTVNTTAHELLGEVGEAASQATFAPSLAPTPGVFTPVAIQHQGSGLPLSHDQVPVEPVMHRRAAVSHPVVALVDSPSDYLKACALHAELVRREHSGLVLVNPFQESDVLPAPALSAMFTLPAEEIHLGASKAAFRDTAIEVLAALDPLFEQLQPTAFCVFGASDGALIATLLARKRSLPVVRIEAGQRSAAPHTQRGLNAQLLDHLADGLLTTTLTSSYTLYREGVATTKVTHVGSLTSDVLLRMLTSVDATAESLMRTMAARGEMIEAPFVIVNAAPRQVAGNFDELRTIVSLLGSAAQLATVIWLADEVTTVALNAARLGPSLKAAGVRLMPPIDGMQTIALIRRAACIVSIGGSAELMEESRCIGLPRIVVGRAAPGTETWGGTFTEYHPERLLRALRDAIRDREESQYAVPTLELAAQGSVERVLSLSSARTSPERHAPTPSLQGA